MMWGVGSAARLGVGVLALAVMLAACQQTVTVDGEQLTFEQIQQGYNVRTERVDQLYARTTVEARWRDERDRRRFEQGDGILMVRKPSELALSVGHGLVAGTMYWVGGDEEQFWVFDLNPPNGEPTTATFGYHEDLDRSGEDVMVPVRPNELMHLLGVMEMPDPAGGQAPQIEVIDGSLVRVEIAADEAGEATWRYVLEPGSWLPQRIALLDAAGEILVSADLSRYEYMQRQGVPPGGWPQIPTRIEVRTPAAGEDTRMTVFLQRDPGPSDGKARDRVQDQHFDLERLLEVHNPAEIRRVSE